MRGLLKKLKTIFMIFMEKKDKINFTFDFMFQTKFTSRIFLEIVRSQRKLFFFIFSYEFYLAVSGCFPVAKQLQFNLVFHFEILESQRL